MSQNNANRKNTRKTKVRATSGVFCFPFVVSAPIKRNSACRNPYTARGSGRKPRSCKICVNFGAAPCFVCVVGFSSHTGGQMKRYKSSTTCQETHAGKCFVHFQKTILPNDLEPRGPKCSNFVDTQAPPAPPVQRCFWVMFLRIKCRRAGRALDGGRGGTSVPTPPCS